MSSVFDLQKYQNLLNRFQCISLAFLLAFLVQWAGIQAHIFSHQTLNNSLFEKFCSSISSYDQEQISESVSIEEKSFITSSSTLFLQSQIGSCLVCLFALSFREIESNVEIVTLPLSISFALKYLSFNNSFLSKFFSFSNISRAPPSLT